MTSLTEQIGLIIQDIHFRREEIKQDWIKAWLAATIPDKNLSVDWLIKNVQLVEQWSDDRTKVTWHLEMKE